MKRTFETELPEGYSPAYEIDAKNIKVGIVMNIIALLIAVIIVVPAWLIIKPVDFFGQYSLSRNILLVIVAFSYIVLHELTHGAAYKMLTHRKLTFGFTLSVAYCGIPDIYVYRNAALIALLAPFAVFIPVFLIPALLMTGPWDKIYAFVMLGLHVGGCIGDLYDTFLYLFRFRSPDTLMRDTGPKQTFYIKNN